MKFAVTHCVFDEAAGGNPLWHSCILLSKMDEVTRQLEVVESWGFYGMPTTAAKGTWLRNLKIKMHMDVDLVGNHGLLKHEEVRFMDLGRGLHGKTFELTQEQFAVLQEKCNQLVRDQEVAVIEGCSDLGVKDTLEPGEKIAYYKGEQYGPLIFACEKVKAQEKQREPRLYPFDFSISLGLGGPSIAGSHTCKSQIISILAEVLSEQQIQGLTEGGKHPTVPRWSGRMEAIYLHSTGPLRPHKKASGETVYFRSTDDAEVKLFWSFPPQEVETLTEKTLKMLTRDEDQCVLAKARISQLQSLEWLLRNAVVDAGHEVKKNILMEAIITCYKAFSIIEPYSEQPSEVSGLKSSVYSFFSWPKNETERSLLKKIKAADALTNTLYFSVVDQWPEGINDEDENDEIDYSLHYLPIKDKKTLCSILGRVYDEVAFLGEPDSVSNVL